MSSVWTHALLPLLQARLVQCVSPHAQDEERLKKAVNTVPSNAELNVMLARSEEEKVKFDCLDRELSWPADEGAAPVLFASRVSACGV
jgi:hypothetical protein